MVKDAFELEITTDSSAAVNAIDSFVDQLLGVGNDAQVILKAVEADPACAIANAQAAAFYLFTGGSVALTQATSLDQGIGIIPWSPLARGFLAGNRSKQSFGETARAKTDEFAHNLYYQDSDFQIVDRVVELAQKHGVKPTQIALAWLLHQPGVTAPIVGASKIEHLKEAREQI
ncbi:aldo/keto reductase [Nostoc sp.]|uniref:aldo/keto reductase n=1 Tax=Nostoc sp. TaxID=1180 RepID=UPI002FF62BBB